MILRDNDDRQKAEANDIRDGTVWHAQVATLGNLIIAAAGLLATFLSVVITAALANEHRFSAIEQNLAVVKDRQDGVISRNADQDARIAALQIQFSVQIDALRQSTTDLAKQLAVHDALSRLSGTGGRQ